MIPQTHHQSTKKMEKDQENLEMIQKDGPGTIGGAGIGRRRTEIKAQGWMHFPKAKARQKAKAKVHGTGMGGTKTKAKAKVREAKVREVEMQEGAKEEAKQRDHPWMWILKAKVARAHGKEDGSTIPRDNAIIASNVFLQEIKR